MYVLSKKIGDGLTPETAFRPAINDALIDKNWSAVDVHPDYFLVKIADDETARDPQDMDVTKENMDAIRARMGLKKIKEKRSDTRRLIYSLAVETGFIADGDHVAVGEKIEKTVVPR